MKNVRPALSLIGIAVLTFSGIEQLPGQSTLVLPGENLPSIEFNQTPFGSALDYLRSRGNESLGKNGRSLNLILIDPDGEISKKPVSLNLTNVPWSTALKYSCDLADVIIEADYATLVVGEKDAVHKLRHSRSQIRHSAGSAPLVHRLGANPMTGIEFQGSLLSEIAEYLRAKSQTGGTNGKATPSPINLIIKENVSRPVADRKVSLTLASAPLSEVLHFATGLAGCRYRIDANAIVIGEDADLKQIPLPQISDRGDLFKRISNAQVASVEIAAGTSIEDLILLFRDYSKDPNSFPDGINIIDSTGEKLTTWTPMKLQNVRLIDLIQYVNEVSGTTFRSDKNALIIVKDPRVTVRPQIVNPAKPTSSQTGNLRFDP